MAQPSKFGKLLIGVKNVCAHKSVPKFDSVDLESDENYKAAVDLFLDFRSQLREVIQHIELFRFQMKEAIVAATKLAQDFTKISHRKGVPGNLVQSWESIALHQSVGLRSTTGDSALAIERILFRDTEKLLLTDLKRQHENYEKMSRLIRERYLLKVELQHYTAKVQGLNENVKVTEERKIRNAEKYDLANDRLREQTATLMQKFYEAELRRKRMLEEDLPKLMDFQKTAYMILAANSEKAMQGLISAPTRFSKDSLQYSTDMSHHYEHSRSNTPPRASSLHNFRQTFKSPRSCSGIQSDSSSSSKGFLPPRSASMPTNQTDFNVDNYITIALSTSLHSHNSADSEFDTELPDNVLKGLAHAQSVANGTAEFSELQQPAGDNVTIAEIQDSIYRGVSMATVNEQVISSSEEEFDEASDNDLVLSREETDNDENLDEGLVNVVALHNFEAREEGDLPFSAGDVIVTSEQEWGSGGWATGICNGRTGLFPSNYTERVD